MQTEWERLGARPRTVTTHKKHTQESTLPTSHAEQKQRESKQLKISKSPLHMKKKKHLSHIKKLQAEFKTISLFNVLK